ncbi:hypothetical protein EUTSA_v10027789mg [Eutrema salsugineum]|uniref:FBD domain-containing protein n=1 Tax=Eutrema salsugineum TaxID=72664 RepID=V4L9W5_EUTSA|nr:hypothetical protein EUTSA_v10027789mg [Eutrema salsugineum]
MGRISGLSDELLVKILSFLPTKVAVSTSILSKQWEFLWMWLPKLEYGSENHSVSEYKRLKCFLDRNLPLHRAPVIESFRLQIRYPHLEPGDIKLWVLTVVSRYLVYLCKSLVTLKLDGKILVDVPRMVCLPCLKTLQLEAVTYLNEDSLQRLLSNCPVLKDLSVEGCEDDNMRKFIVIVPSLQRLTLIIYNELDEFVINTPSLEYLKFDYSNMKSHHFLIENIPKLGEAYVDAIFPCIERLIGSITSVKILIICLLGNSSENVYGDGFVFKQLVHLKLCKCRAYASNVVVRLLRDSPKLRVLHLLEMEDHEPNGVVLFWNQPSTVPECMLSSLRTFKFERYLGRPEERDLVVYILKNARRLKTATILSEDHEFETLDMIRELALSSRASTKCQLVFDW